MKSFLLKLALCPTDMHAIRKVEAEGLYLPDEGVLFIYNAEEFYAGYSAGLDVHSRTAQFVTFLGVLSGHLFISSAQEEDLADPKAEMQKRICACCEAAFNH